MQYTSAAEGFYGSLRARFLTENTQNQGSGLQNGTGGSFGIRGSNDLGNGLSGFYQFEASFNNNENDNVQTHIAHVGLEGAFGRVWAGTGGVENYGMVYGVSDVANISSGQFVTNRQNQVLQYRTPDIGGFQGALGFQMIAGADNDIAMGNADMEDDNNVDTWYSSARYSVQGFTGGFSYIVKPDTESMVQPLPVNNVVQQAAAMTDDSSEWATRLSYAQDNWSVGGWYGKKKNDRQADAVGGIANVRQDTKTMSIAGNVSVGKVGLYALYEQQEASYHDDGKTMHEDAYTTLGITYHLSSRSRVWMEYAGQDLESDADAEDYVNVGLRHNF
jgi:predicted porin